MTFIYRSKCFLLFVLLIISSQFLLHGNTNETPRLELPSLKPQAHIVFLISKDPLNYEADKTIPRFAEMLRKEYGFRVTVLLSEGKHGEARFKGIGAVEEADLLVVFCRRLALPFGQMDKIKAYLLKGKPLIGLRTANHGFSVWDEVSDGYEGWWGFVPDILGCENRGYEPEELGTIVEVIPESATNPILKGVDATDWKSKGQVYKVNQLVDSKTTTLLRGHPRGTEEMQPIAWTRQTAHKSKVFYTSLGFPDDFEVTPFRKMIINAIHWALNLEIK